MEYLTRRVLTSIVVFVVVLNLVFILPRLVPGNAADVLASTSKLPAVETAILTKRFGLDQPVTTQYILYLKGMFLTFPPFFGFSYQYYPSQVSALFFERLPWTLLLIGTSLFLAFVISYFLNVYNASRRGGKSELSSLIGAIVLHGTPVFWTGIMLIFAFGVYLRWFPMFGLVSANPGTGLSYVESVLWHLALPVITLTGAIFGQIYLTMRGSTQRVLNSDYVIASKTRGLKDSVVARRYIVRNSLLPVVSLVSFSLSYVLGAVILVEAVFGYTGVGDLVFDGILSRDYPVLEGALFYFTLMVIIGGLIGDVVLLRLDPRLRR